MAEPSPELLFGPYETPVAKEGDRLMDELSGLTEVGGYSNGPIPWPRRKKTGRHSLLLTGDLVRAVRFESVEAICHYWGVGKVTVWSWRKALGVGRITDGTRELLRERTGVPTEASALGRQRAASPESRKKMIQTKTGLPAHPKTKSALLRAAKAPKPEGWGKRANSWMLKAKKIP